MSKRATRHTTMPAFSASSEEEALVLELAIRRLHSTRNALHDCRALRVEKAMTAPAERMKIMRERRGARGLRELRIVVADPRSRAVRRRVAKQVAGLDANRERDALRWIESVSEFDADATR